MEENNTVALNRAELIKRARESCLEGTGDNPSYIGKRDGERFRNNIDGMEVSPKKLKIKFFIIRLIIAGMLLLSVILLDQFKVEYQNFSSKQIISMIHSNKLYEGTKELVDRYVLKDKNEK